MIPSTNSKLLVAEDWTKIYQSFNNSDFKSYDFETLRRTKFNLAHLLYIHCWVSFSRDDIC